MPFYVLSIFSLQLSLLATLEVRYTSILPLLCCLNTNSLFGDPVCAKMARYGAHELTDWLKQVAPVTTWFHLFLTV